MNNIWVLVANQTEAQIYSTDRIRGSLALVGRLTHKEGAAHVRDLVSDAPGRVRDHLGQARHSMEPGFGVKEEQRRRFVKEIIERLETALARGRFDQLVLMAAPAVLGVIRKTMNGGIAQTVIKEIPKGVIGQDADRIQAHVERAFALK